MPTSAIDLSTLNSVSFVSGNAVDVDKLYLNTTLIWQKNTFVDDTVYDFILFDSLPFSYTPRTGGDLLVTDINSDLTKSQINSLLSHSPIFPLELTKHDDDWYDFNPDNGIKIVNLH